jgi:hypothetical protein
LPAASVKLTEIRSKVVFEEHPALARFRGFEAALARVATQDGGRHAQERGGFGQVERAHGLSLFMAVQPHVVAPRLGLGLAPDVGLQAFGKLPRRIVVIRLERV